MRKFTTMTEAQQLLEQRSDLDNDTIELLLAEHLRALQSQ